MVIYKGCEKFYPFQKITKFKYYSLYIQLKRGFCMSVKKVKCLLEHFSTLRSSQAALEFLMTYGWAILVVLIAVSALAYFGVLSPGVFLPERCTLPSGIACLDFRVESYKVIIVLQNGLGEPITMDKVIISSNNQQCLYNETTALNNNDKAIITATECNNGEAGQKFNGAINITYTVENKLTHTIAGTLRTKIVEGQSVSSQNICQNAQDNNLCDGLDIVYGLGYKAACCGEYGLCCS